MDKLIEEGEKLNKNYNIPSIQELLDINKFVKQFIKDNKLIIFGGIAINEVLKLKGDSIYTADKIPDYDVISTDNNRDSIELSNILFANGFQYINRVIALNDYTFRIFVNLSPEAVCDLRYIPKSILTHIPTFTIDDLLYISPEYLKIDFYKSFVDVNNLYRWKDKHEYERFLKLELAYPSQKVDYSPNSTNSQNSSNSLLKIFKQFNVIFTGNHTYNRLMQFMKYDSIPLSCVDIYYHNPNEIINYIKKNTNYTISNHHPLLDHLPESYIIYNNNNIIGNIYNLNSIYIPNIPVIKIGDEYHGQYHYLLLYLHICLLKYRVLGNDKLLQQTYYMIYEIQTKRENYLNVNGLTGLDINNEKGNPINIFNLDYDNPPLSFKEKVLIRRQFEETESYGYKPNKKIIVNKVREYKYPKIDYSIIGSTNNSNKTANKNTNKTFLEKIIGGGESNELLDMTKRDEVVIKYITKLGDYIVERNKKKYIEFFNANLKSFIEEFIIKHKLIIINNIFMKLIDNSYNISDSEYHYVVYGNQQVKEYAKDFMNDLLLYISENQIELKHYEIVQVDSYRFNLMFNFRVVLTLIKLRDDVFDNMPHFVLDSKLRVLNTDLIRLNIYNVYTNPRKEIAKWKSTIEIEKELDKLYPIEKIKCNQRSKSLDKDILNKLWEFLKKDGLIVIGDKAINVLLNKNIVNIPYYSVLSNDAKKLIEELGKVMTGIKTESKQSYLKLYPKKYIVRMGEKKIMEIYDITDECIPYYVKDGYFMGTYNVIMKYLYIELYEKQFKYCNEIKERIYIMSQHKAELELDKIFRINCLGMQKDLVREFKLKRFTGIDPKTGKSFKLAKYK